MIVHDSIVGFNSGSGAGTFPYVPLSGFSFRVRKYNQLSSMAFITGLYMTVNSPMRIQILSPHLHDAVNGLVFIGENNPEYDSISEGVLQKLSSEDLLQFNAINSHGNTAFVMTVCYEDLQDTHTSYISGSEFLRHEHQLKPFIYSPPTSVSMSEYSAAVQVQDGTFKADKFYALLGAQGIENGFILRIRSKETGGFSLTIPPANYAVNKNGAHFLNMSKRFNNLKSIPVFYGENLQTAIVDVVGGTATLCSLQFVELKGFHQ